MHTEFHCYVIQSSILCCCGGSLYQNVICIFPIYTDTNNHHRFDTRSFRLYHPFPTTSLNNIISPFPFVCFQTMLPLTQKDRINKWTTERSVKKKNQISSIDIGGSSAKTKGLLQLYAAWFGWSLHKLLKEKSNENRSRRMNKLYFHLHYTYIGRNEHTENTGTKMKKKTPRTKGEWK